MAVSFSVAVLVGSMLGFLAGLGIGGGSLLMLWLTLTVGFSPVDARCINLMFFLPCALCSSFFRLKQGTLPIKKILLPTALGCAMAAGCSYLSNHLDVEILKKIFGVLLLFTGIREIFYKSKKACKGS